MRDDIHKRVPRPPKVQRWVKLALREADRLADRTAGALEDAVHDACKSEISGGLLRGLLRYMNMDQSDLFGALGGVQSPRELGGDGSPMERTILSDCQRLTASGRSLREAAQEAIADALRERSHADIRAAEPVLLPTRDPEAYRAIDQMKADVGEFNYRAIAAERLGLQERQPRSAPALSPDENLLGPSGRKTVRP
jgi:hypothetical protein